MLCSDNGSVAGYIHIKTFGHNTARSTERAIVALQAQGASRFVIDLRGNPGGLIQAGHLRHACSVSADFACCGPRSQSAYIYSHLLYSFIIMHVQQSY